MQSPLTIPDIAHLIVDITAVEPNDDRVKTLAVLRLLNRTMHAHATHPLFQSVHILSTDKLAAMPDILRSTSVAPHITALTIGPTGRMPPHTPSQSLLHVDYGILAEAVKLLPNLQTLKIGAVDPQAVFRLPSHEVSPNHARSSYAVVFSSDSMQADPLVEPPWQSALVVVPKPSAWVGAAKAGVVAGHTTAYANAIRLNESELPGNLAAVLGAGSSVVAFYGGTVCALINFGKLVLPSMDRVLRSLTISWTAAHALRYSSDIIKAVRTGISSCTQIEHLTFGLFVGSTAAVPPEDQWEAIMSLLGAANRTTLRTLTLVVAVHEDSALTEHLRGFENLQWDWVTHLLPARMCPTFEVVAFKVIGASPDAAERIEWAMRHGLGHGCRVRRSKDVLCAAFS